jgi:hypothetical protein
VTSTQKSGNNDNDVRGGDINENNDDKIYEVKHFGDCRGFKICK